MLKNSADELLRREARYLSMRRSTRELETILSDFFEREWMGMDGKTRMEFLKILRQEDADLERYLFKNQPPSPELCRALVEKLRAHIPK
ncbi:MAG: hypothetical protein GTN70_01620 [Deltaproteobacteria bacterium]|nr:hypothetical protein [Deltaproteobacteria bacterium]NIS76345.1 hypothetical protein [Deltaproteobacteria bacterium]